MISLLLQQLICFTNFEIQTKWRPTVKDNVVPLDYIKVKAFPADKYIPELRRNGELLDLPRRHFGAIRSGRMAG